MVEDLAQPIEAEHDTSGPARRTLIRFRGPDMRPYVRFLIAREVYRMMVEDKHPATLELTETPKEVLDIQANIFAGMLLIPAHLLRQEVERIDSSLDIVAQLADTFWVSKALMNQRLRDYLENLD
jgi:Zn-dependent peptidase ImmA (M78 family)